MIHITEENMNHMVKTKKFVVKLVSLDVTGVVVKTQELSMEIVDDPNSRINNERLFIHIGEYIYRIDKNGVIIN